MKKLILIALSFFAFANVNAQTPPTVYVAGDGTGDFNAYGDTCQIVINQALDFVAANSDFTTVYLIGPHTYFIDDPIFISSNTIFTGDSTAKIELKENVAWWTQNKPMIAQKGRISLPDWNAWGDYGDDISNVEIYGFEISGGLLQEEPTGAEFIPIIHFCYPHNVSIHDMHLHDNCWDIVRLTSSGGAGGDELQDCNNSKVYNNLIEYSGHEGVCFVGLKNFEVYNNTIYSTRTNCGVRCKDTDVFDVHDNIIGNAIAKYSSGYAGIFVENQYAPLTEHAEIFNNVIYGKNGGIHLGSDEQAGSPPYPFGTRKNIHIHHNKIYKIKDDITSTGFLMEAGISVAGYDSTLIEHNIIDGSTTDGIIFNTRLADGTGYKTIVRNNIIMNVMDTALNNRDALINTFVSDNNLFFNNGVNYANASSTTDIFEDPLFATTHSTLHQWHHIVATYSNTTETMKIYIDGVEDISRTLPGFGNMATNTDNLILGIEGSSGYSGRMDELAIWNKALSATEISNLYNNGTPVSISGDLTAGLQVYLPMDNTWDDVSGNNFNAEGSTATFTSDAILGSHAGLFNDTTGVQYPTTLSTTDGITISLWAYRTDLTNDYQPLVYKGDIANANAFNLYFTEESVEFDVGDGTYIATLEANVLNPWDIDYHVKSKQGHWNGSSWVNDTITSPCVDGGYVLSDYSSEPVPNGGRVNIGVYGNTVEASKSDSTNNIISISSDDNLLIYPNPTSAKIFVDERFIDCKYEVFSITGTLLISGKIENNSIDLSKLNTGIYFVRIFEMRSGRINVAKIIKKSYQ